MTTSPHTSFAFTSLTPEQEMRYEQIKRAVSELIATDPDGLMFVLNAVALTGDTTLAIMGMWTDEGLQMDSRALVGIIDDRPLSLPQLVL